MEAGEGKERLRDFSEIPGQQKEKHTGNLVLGCIQNGRASTTVAGSRGRAGCPLGLGNNPLAERR